MKSPRFVVSQVTGFEIRPGTSSSGSKRSVVPTSFYVLDRAYSHRVVAAFDSADPPQQRVGALGRKRRAEERAAELNANG